MGKIQPKTCEGRELAKNQLDPRGAVLQRVLRGRPPLRRLDCPLRRRRSHVRAAGAAADLVSHERLLPLRSRE